MSSRDTNLRRLYGISLQTYEALLAHQNGVCALCESSPETSKGGVLTVDHNHQNGAIRGLLCTKCNLMLAMYELCTVEKVDEYLTSRAGGVVLNNEHRGRALPSSGVRGVTIDGNQFAVRIRNNGSSVNVGRYASLVEAASAYRDAYFQLHGLRVLGVDGELHAVEDEVEPTNLFFV